MRSVTASASIYLVRVVSAAKCPTVAVAFISTTTTHISAAEMCVVVVLINATVTVGHFAALTTRTR